MEHTSLAVVIPVLNAEKHLKRLIKSLHSQQRKADEILVIDSGSEDHTVSIAKSLGVDLLELEPGQFDHGATRNSGVSRTKSEVVIFMTQDALPVNEYTLENLVKPLQQKKIVISYGRQVPGPDATPSEKFLRLSNYPPVSIVKSAGSISSMGIRAFQNSDVCSAYKRREFEALGRFPEPVVCNEDMIMAARAIFTGYSVAYTADALVFHTHELSPGQLFKRYFDIAASLEHEPRIMEQAAAEQSGLDFFKKQLKFLKNEKCLAHLPRVILETGAKYTGYRCGLKHRVFPAALKKHLGMNRLYWTKKRGRLA